MYLLLKSDGSSLHLKNGETYLVGRKETNFILLDKTVSKKHAKITVRNKTVYVEDLNSSNKTFINAKALLPKVETQVKVGSQIKFGSLDSNFILKKDDLIITASGLSKSDKDLLKKLIEKMSGSITANWNSVCTHVVVSEIVLTVKVLSALILKKPLVTVDYFKARLNWIESNGPPPKIDDFRPKDKLHKPMIIDYETDRTNLFKNRIFVFPNKESKKKMESIIALAGGSSISFDSDPVQKTNLIKKTVEYIFVITPENTQSEHTEFNDCVKHLIDNNRRSVPMSEIAMAIAAANCEVECNPSFDKVAHVMGGERQEIRSDVIALETQTQLSSLSSYDSNCSVQCIPSSLSPSSCEQMEVEIGGKRLGEELVRDVKKSKGDDSDSRVSSSQKEVKKVQMKIDEIFKKPDSSSISASSRMDSRSSDISDNESLDNVSTSSASQSIKRKSEEQVGKTPKKSKFTLSQLFPSTQSSNISPIKNVETQKVDDSIGPGTSTQLDSINPFQKIEIKQKKDTNNPFLNFGLKKKEPTKQQKDLTESAFKKKEPTKPQKDITESAFKKKEPTKPETDLTEITDGLEKLTHKEKSGDLFQIKNNNKRSSSADMSTMSATETNAHDTGLVNKKVKVIPGKENNVKLFSSTSVDERSIMNVTAISNLSHGTNCNRWLNKSSTSITTKSTKDDEISEEMKAYIKNFKPARVIVVSASSLIVRRPQDITINTINSTLNSKLPNFKKFKKVKPLHEQTEIIPSERFVTVVCGENANKVTRDFEESVLNTQPIRKPTGFKSKFNFEF